LFFDVPVSEQFDGSRNKDGEKNEYEVVNEKVNGPYGLDAVNHQRNVPIGGNCKRKAYQKYG
jgi:hypothetical protein